MTVGRGLRSRDNGRGRWPHLIAFAVGLACIPHAAFADEPELKEHSPVSNWSIFGEITNRYDHYWVAGDRTQNPHSFLGPHYFGEFSVFANRRISRYEQINARMFGVFNRSDYRNSTYENFILERGTFNWTKGDAAIPFRFEGGDYFGNLSLRTMQRSLKGAQVELQPKSSNPAVNRSFLIFSGITDPLYRGVNVSDEIFSGASYLHSSPLGDINFNLVHNYREANSALGLPARQQYVASIAGEKQWRKNSQALTFEFEAARFSGDYGSSVASLNQSRQDYGFFAQLNGRSLTKPFSYRLAYERYGEHFRPHGGSVSANRESMEAHGTYRHRSGLITRARVQRYVDQLESSNPTATHTAGIDFIGPFNWFGLSDGAVTGNISSFISDASNRDNTVQSRNYSTSAGFATQINNRTIASWGGSYNRNDNWITGTTTQRADVYAGIDWTKAISKTSFRIGPRMTVRRSWGATSDVYDFGPSVSADLFHGNHSFSANYSYLFQDGRGPILTDTGRHSATVRYSYNNGPHSLGLEGGYLGRDTNPGTQTKGFHVGAFYTFRFAAPKETQTVQVPVVLANDPSEVRLADLAPGTLLSKAESRLASAGITGGVRRGNLIIYNVVWLDGVFSRQRLVLVHDESRITKAVVLISFQDTGNSRSSAQFFNEVRDGFIRRYGTPYTIEEGEFGTNFAGSVNTNRLIRIAEWQQGRSTIRLGIPRRIDRAVQIEVHIAPSFPGQNQTRWGLDEVR